MTSPTSRLFVTGLPWGYTESQLLQLFVPHGRIIDIRIIKDNRGKSKGMGYVEFDQLESAVTAKQELHNFKLREDRSIIVDFAKPDPFLTPEGQARHEQALTRKKSKPEPKNKIRQSVFDSRHFGSNIGKKFASRTKKAKHKQWI